MMRNLFFYLGLLWLGLVSPAGAESRLLKDLPDGIGVAGPFVGLVDDELIVAGGANFPDKAPWEGGAKQWHRLVQSLETPEADWTELGELPEALAYGGSVSLEEGLLCIGGGNAERHSDRVFLIRKSGDGLDVVEYPALPQPLSNFACVRLGDQVHVVGGSTAPGAKEASNGHMVLDLSDLAAGWQAAAELPARGRIFPVAAGQGGDLYVFSGAALNPDGSRSYLNDAWVFEGGQAWRQLPDLPRAALGAPSPALTSASGELLIFGGDDGSKVKIGAKPEHPGFCRDLLVFDPESGEWSQEEPLRDDIAAPVTTASTLWNGAYVIASGERKPGVRTPQIHLYQRADAAAADSDAAPVVPVKRQLGWINWTVLVTYLGLMVGVGYWFMKRNAAASTDAYFRGGQSLPSWVVGLSIFATMLSSLTFMGIPARSFQTDCSWYLGQLTILIVVPVVAYGYLPKFRNLGITSAYEFLEHRFNLPCRLFGCFSFILFHLGRIGIVLYLPAVALASVSDIPVDQAILWIGILCVIYTVMGGITAVVWTDAIQAIVLMGGALFCFVIALWQAEGGLSAVWEISTNDAKLFQSVEWTGFSVEDGTTSAFILFLAFFFNALVPYTSGQDMVQRYVTTPNLGEARKSLRVTMWMSIFGSLVFFLLGVAVYAFYKTNPGSLDPAVAGNDAILPFFILQQLPVGVSGLVIAAIFAASQSTISSSLNSISSTWVTDVDARLIRPKAGDKAYLKAAQYVVIISGALGIGAALWMAQSEVASAFKVFNNFVGLAAGSLGGIFALGMFTRRVGGKAAFIGAIGGFAAVLSIYFMKLPITGLLNAAMGFALCCVIGFLASFIFTSDIKSES